MKELMVSKKLDDNGRLFLNVVDKELLGKKFEEGNKVLDLTRDYYKGDLMDREEVVKLFKKSFCINFIGNGSVELGEENNMIKNELEIKGIKYAFMMRC